MIKNIVIGLVVIGVAYGLFTLVNKEPSSLEQQVFKSTYDSSKEYLSLRLQTNNALVNAKNYPDYESWNKEMTKIIGGWEKLEKDVSSLEDTANKMADEKTSLKLMSSVLAYDKQEITNIIDKAPIGKKIITLAKHLGTDAKHAQAILNQSQAEIQQETWTNEGDTYNKLENTAIVVKDGCKVVGFVGGVVLTGGVAGLATAGTLTTATTVVVGVDLALEVTEDGAQIAFGDRNKVSSFVKGARTVTEPIANVLTITNIPGNLGTAFGKFDSVMVGLEQFRESAQDGKVIGVDLTNFEYHKPFARIRQAKYPATVSAAEMEMAEVEAWLKSLNKKLEPMTQEEVKEFLSSPVKETEPEKEAIKEETKTNKVEDEKEATENKTNNTTNQIIKIVNVSSNSFMMDTCFSSTCWDDLAANPAEDRDLGGIYTMGKVFSNGQHFKTGFRPSDLKASDKLVETSPNSYKITLYFAIAPFEGPKNKTIEYGTWQNHSIEIKANYGDEPVIEWDGNGLKQVK